MRKTYMIFIFTLFLILSSCASESSTDITDMSKEYLYKLVNIDVNVVDIGSFSEQDFEKNVNDMYVYLDNNFKDYFTMKGYERFINNELYRTRVKFLKNNNITHINNINIDLKLAKKEDNTIAYDYTITYTAESSSGHIYDFSDEGQLVFKKNSEDNIFKIDTDYTKYYDEKYKTVQP